MGPAMSKAIRVHRTGGPEVLQWEDITVGRPGEGEALIKHTAVGVNFIDVYHRSGLYHLSLPFIPGQEGSAVVEAIGRDVVGLRPGDRVAYAGALGAYCESRVIAADQLVKMPAHIDGQVAAAVMLKGLTAEYLLRRTFKVGPGHIVLFHAAAGGVGLIACQWAKALGATVIGTVGSEAKAVLAAENGCDHVINYRTEDIVARVLELTDGQGVDVVYDGVGRDTFPASLDMLKPRGMWVSFGQSSGPIPDFSPLLLAAKGSLIMTRPRLADYIADRAELETSATALFAAMAAGDIRITVNQSFRLADAADAHRALESRSTTGSTILIP